MAQEDSRVPSNNFEAVVASFGLAGPMGDYPGLRHLFGTYLGVDFADEYGHWRNAIQGFKREEPHLVDEVLGDLDRLRSAEPDEAQLGEVLAGLNCGVERDMCGGTWSAWLGRVQGELAGSR